MNGNPRRPALSAETSAHWIADLSRVGRGSVIGRESIVQSPMHIRPGDLIISGAERYRVAGVGQPVRGIVEVRLVPGERRHGLYLQAATPVRVVRARRAKKAPKPSP